LSILVPVGNIRIQGKPTLIGERQSLYYINIQVIYLVIPVEKELIMIKLLLTGFEPFGGYKINPSEVIAQKLDSRVISNISVIGKTIPLRYKEICTFTYQLIEETNPSFIINLGQAPRSSIAIERVALNLVDASKVAYNCGSTPDNKSVVEEGPVAYFSSLPVKKLTEFLLANDIPSYVSNTAGTFGCNQIMYCTLNYLHQHSLDKSVKAGFIHLPLLPEQTINSPQSASMSLEMMLKAIELIIQYLGNSIEAKN
jgi:pyroglutamyl-peptidase